MALVIKNLPTCAGDMRHGFSPWVGKILRRRAWQPTPVFLPGASHGQSSLVDYNPWGQKRRMWLKWLSTLNLLQYCFCFMFLAFGQEACKILAPWPGLEPAFPTLEGEVSTMRPLEKSRVYWGSKHHSSISTECPCLLVRKKAGHHIQFKITCG